MKKVLLATLAIAGVIGAGAVLTRSANASDLGRKVGQMRYGFNRMIQTKAEILGMDPAELKDKLGEKTFVELAQEKGISLEQIHEQMEQKAKERWQEMGLSQEEIEERERLMEERHANCDGGGMMRFGGQRMGGN